MKTLRLTASVLAIALGTTLAQQASTPAAPAPAAAPATASGDTAAVFRIWHDVQGRTFEATFRGVEGENVFLQAKNGFVYRIPLLRLAADDQAAAKTLKPAGLGIPADPNLAQAAAKIDEIVEIGLKAKNVPHNALANDEQFVRRVYLDLAGRIPTKEETQEFLGDTSSSKRAKVIDKLIASEGFTSHMFNYFSDMLRMADDAQKAKFFTYEEWFKDQLKHNRPWNEIVHDMMTADGKLLENGAAGYLLRDKGMRLDNLSLTLSTFLGANVACAQCHDHPFSDWTQRQFYEMASFFGETETYDKRGAYGGTKNLRQELSQQEFQQARKLMLANALDVKDTHNNDLTLPDDYKYKDAKPGDAVAPKLIMWQPKTDALLSSYKTAMAELNVKGKKAAAELNPRDVFAQWMTSPDNPRFAMTIANRLWKLVFGVGVKEPIYDLDVPDDSNNPMLLYHLSKEMVRLKFDIRAYMRLLCNTQAYQREAITKQITPGEPYYFPGPILRRMTAEQAWDSCVTLAIGDKVDGYKIQRADKYSEVMLLKSGDMNVETIKTKLDEMRKARGLLAGGGANKPAKNPKKAAMMARRMQNSQTDLDDVDTTKPQMLDGLVLARASELPQPERDQHFLRMFGQSDRQIADSGSDEGSVPQVLMLMNGEAQNVLRNQKSLVLSTAMNQASPKQQIASLYLSFFSRMPKADEMEEAEEALKTGLTLSDLTWVLFNTREFIFVQ
jgi:hypothetical protein